jgi:hypothetical protein
MRRLFEIESESEAWSCYLRPAPPGLSLDTNYTHNHVMEAIEKQRWYPKYCYYCYSCPLRNPDAWENHVIRHHGGKLAYPGPTPVVTRTILEIIEENERRNKTTVVERRYVVINTKD